MNNLKKILAIFFLGLLTIGCNHSLPEVIGTITKVEIITVENISSTKENRVEARIYLEVSSALDRNGEIVNPNNYDYPYFASKDLSLNDKLKEGDKVKIVYTSSVGRHIETIEIIK